MSFPVENETDEGSSAAKAISLSETCASDGVCSLIPNADTMKPEDSSNSVDLRVTQNQTAPGLQQLIVQNQAILQKHGSDEENDNETDRMVDSHPGVNKAYFVVINDQNQEVMNMNDDEEQNFIMNEKSQLDGGAEMDIEKLQRMNSGYDNSEDIANSSFGEENILEHLSRQVTLQHQFLCNAISVNNDNPSIDRIYEETSNSNLASQQMTSATTTPVTSCVGNVVSISDQYAILPSLLHQSDVQNTCYMSTTPQNNIYSHQPVTDEDHLHDATEPSEIPNQDSVRHAGTPIDPQRFVTLPNGSGRYIYTPHPKTGQLLYVSCEDSSPQLFQRLPPGSAVTTPLRVDTSSQFVTPKITRLTPGQMPEGITRLNSSGEDTNSPDCPSDVSPPHYGSPSDSSDDKCTKFTSIDLTQALFCGSGGGGGGEESREQHNMKERRRRARVKDACDVMRKLVPGMSDKTDKATVFEFAARYIHYLKGFSGTRHDKDFLLKYSPY